MELGDVTMACVRATVYLGFIALWAIAGCSLPSREGLGCYREACTGVVML